jgi:hypothetical protein
MAGKSSRILPDVNECRVEDGLLLQKLVKVVLTVNVTSYSGSLTVSRRRRQSVWLYLLFGSERRGRMRENGGDERTTLAIAE